MRVTQFDKQDQYSEGNNVEGSLGLTLRSQ